jgi:uncharacterized Zn finger protein
MRRRRDRGPRILLCPQCGSPRIELASALITGQVYRCLACGYVGSLVYETDQKTLEAEARKAAPPGRPLP